MNPDAAQEIAPVQDPPPLSGGNEPGEAPANPPIGRVSGVEPVPPPTEAPAGTTIDQATAKDLETLEAAAKSAAPVTQGAGGPGPETPTPAPDPALAPQAPGEITPGINPGTQATPAPEVTNPATNPAFPTPDATAETPVQETAPAANPKSIQEIPPTNLDNPGSSPPAPDPALAAPTTPAPTETQTSPPTPEAITPTPATPEEPKIDATGEGGQEQSLSPELQKKIAGSVMSTQYLLDQMRKSPDSDIVSMAPEVAKQTLINASTNIIAPPAAEPAQESKPN